MNLQYNLTTNVPYEGQNQAELLSAKEFNGYKSDAWVTFVQARNMGKKLVNAKGKGIHLRTFSRVLRKDEKGKESLDSIPSYFVVFNEDLLEDIVEDK